MTLQRHGGQVILPTVRSFQKVSHLKQQIREQEHERYLDVYKHQERKNVSFLMTKEASKPPEQWLKKMGILLTMPNMMMTYQMLDAPS